MAAQAAEQPVEVLLDALRMQQLVQRSIDAQSDVPLQLLGLGPEAGPPQAERYAVARIADRPPRTS